MNKYRSRQLLSNPETSILFRAPKRPTINNRNLPSFPMSPRHQKFASATRCHTPLPMPKLTQALNRATSGPQVSFAVAP